MKVYVLNITLKDDPGGDIAGVYSSEEKAEAAGKEIEERCKEHDIYKYGFYGWYVTEYDLDNEDEEESVNEDPITIQRVLSDPNTHKDYFKIIFRSDNFAELLRTMHENGKIITVFWYDFDVCTLQNKFVLEFDELKKEIEKNDAANKSAEDA